MNVADVAWWWLAAFQSSAGCWALVARSLVARRAAAAGDVGQNANWNIAQCHTFTDIRLIKEG